VRTAIEAHDGYLFSHTGDGVVAAFASPRSAVDASIAAQRALELPVRMGLATGEAELMGADYFGTVCRLPGSWDHWFAMRMGPVGLPATGRVDGD
jgi:class 3 adenylate cyclase